MALGTITRQVDAGVDRGANLLKALRLSFPGDGAYPTGGTAGFRTEVEKATGRKMASIVELVAGDCGGYVPAYDQVADKLKVYQANYPAAGAGALTEVPNATNLSATTFNVTVLFR